MTTISIQKDKIQYNDDFKSFYISGKAIRFDTSYIIRNDKTGGEVKFDFKESNGSEWDPNTIWAYKSDCGTYHLLVGNDDVTKAHAQAYLDAKLKNAPKHPGDIHPNQLGGDGYAMLYMQNGIES